MITTNIVKMSTVINNPEEQDSCSACGGVFLRDGVNFKDGSPRCRDCDYKYWTGADPRRLFPPQSSVSNSGPRLITAEEVLAERASLSDSGSFPHGTGRGWSSYKWVSCDCPPCRNEYDPTGEETAKYMNMEYPSFFNGQAEKPSFSFSELVKQSYLAHMGPGFYIGGAKKAATLEDVVLVITPPLPLKPKRILYIAPNHDWDEFILSDDKSYWTRRSYEKGRTVWRGTEDPDKEIPFLELGKRLTEIYGSA